jgi:uncharacterized membrane protein
MKQYIATAGLILMSWHTLVGAQLRVCNYTREPVQLALNWKKSGEWINDGWWTVNSGRCMTPSGQPDQLKNRYYYYYATRADGTTWGGGEDGANGCVVAGKNFESTGENCPSDAQIVTYRKVDTGDAPSYTITLTNPDKEPFDSANKEDTEIACELLNRNLDKPRLRSEPVKIGSYTDPFTLPQTRSECTNTYDTGVPDPSTCSTECVQEWRTDIPPARGCMRWETRCSNVIACNTWKTEKKTMECDLVFRIKLPNYVERPLSDFIDESYSIAENMRGYAKTALPMQCAAQGNAGVSTSEQTVDRLRELVRSTIEREAREWLQETAIETIAASIPTGGVGGSAIMSTQLAQFVYRMHKALKPIIKVANETKEFAEDLGFDTSCGWSDWHLF